MKRLINLLLIITILFNGKVSAQAIMNTFAGNGSIPAAIGNPGYMAVDKAGNIYFTSSTGVIQKYSPLTHLTTVFAGGAASGSTNGDGGPANEAVLSQPAGLAVDRDGNLYIAEYYDIRKVTVATNIITTAVSGLYIPFHVALDDTGNIYITDDGSVRKYSVNTGNLTTLAKNFSDAGSLTIDKQGNVLVANDDPLDCSIYQVTQAGVVTRYVGFYGSQGYQGDNGPANQAWINYPMGLTIDSIGDLFFSDSYNTVIRRVDANTNIITTVLGKHISPGGSDYGDGKPASKASLGNGSVLGSQDLGFDSLGNFYLVDQGNAVIRKVDHLTGIINTIAGSGVAVDMGDGHNVDSSLLNNPAGVALDSKGNIYIADCSNNRIRKVDATTHIITTFAGTGSSSFTGDTIPAIEAALSGPQSLAIDPSDNIYIAEKGSRIRRIDGKTGIITTVLGNIFSTGIATDRAGNIYYCDATSETVSKIDGLTHVVTTVAGNGNSGYTGDSGPAINAELNYPYAVAIDTSGNIYITDLNEYCIRKVTTATGIITTVAGAQYGEHYESLKDLFCNYSNNCIYIVDADSKLSGMLSRDYLVAVAGNGIQGFAGDGEPVNQAEFNNPLGIAVDSAGNVYIADASNNRIRNTHLCIQYPLQPDTVIGPDTVISGSTVGYRINNSDTSFTYTWSYPSDWTIVKNDSGTIELKVGTMNGMIALISQNQCGSSPSTGKNVIVKSSGCQSDFILYPATGVPHLWYALNLATGAAPLSYTWYWGDGTSSTGVTPSHTYSVPGWYNICLSIKDDSGCRSSFCDSSNVYRTENGSEVYIQAVTKIPTETINTNQLKNINIYPNPASENITICSNDNEKIHELIITNIIGQIVSNIILSPDNSKISLTLPVANGFYFIHIKTELTDYFGKVIKE